MAFVITSAYIARQILTCSAKRSLISFSDFAAPAVLYRLFTTGKAKYAKEIRYTETDKETVIEGVMVPSPRDGQVMMIPGESNACPLCKLGLKNLRYTDVLILSQFVQSDGKVIPQHVTGLCGKQHWKVVRLVRQAQKSGLLPSRSDKVPLNPWESNNSYYKD